MNDHTILNRKALENLAKRLQEIEDRIWSKKKLDRNRGESSDEGASQTEEPIFPRVNDLLLAARVAELLFGDKPECASIAEAAKRLKKTNQTVQDVLKRIRVAFNEPTFLTRVGKGSTGAKVRESDQPLLRKLAKILAALDETLRPSNITVQIGLPHIISATIFHEITALFHQNFKSRSTLNVVPVNLTLNRGETLIQADEKPKLNNDVILTSYELNFGEVLAGPFPFELALLCPAKSGLKKKIGIAVAEAEARGELTKGYFPDEALSGQTAILVGSDNKPEINSWLEGATTRNIYVDTFDEAFNYVAGGAGVCVAFPILLNEYIQKYVNVIDLREKFSPAKLRLLRSPACPPSDKPLFEAAINALATSVKVYFSSLGESHAMSLALLRRLEAFHWLYQTTPEMKQYQRAELDLWSTPLYIRGVSKRSESENQGDYRIFGRVCGETQGPYNLLLREESPDKTDQIASYFVFSSTDLASDAIRGTMVGAAGVGLAILSKNEIKEYNNC